MKLKLYLRMVLVTMTALFVATGCSSSGTDEPPVGPVDEPLTFEIQVSDVATGEATVAVKPSKATSTYYCGAIVKADFDAFATEAAFFAAETKRIEAAAAAEKMTVSAYVQMYSYRGEGNRIVTTTEAETPYYAYVYGIKADGSATSKVFKTEFTSADVPPPAAEPGLEIVSMKAGTNTGTMKDTRIYMVAEITGTPAVSGLYGMFQTSYVETQLAGGATYETIVADATPMDAQFLEYIHDGGIGLTFGTAAAPLTPETSYTVILLATSAEGGTIVKHQSASTEAGGGGGTGLELTLGALTPGTADGSTPESAVTTLAKSQGAVSGKWGVFSKSSIDDALAKGQTLEEIMNKNGNDLTPERVTVMNSSTGLSLSGTGIPAGMEVTIVVRVADAEGNMLAKAVSGTPAGGGGETGDLTFTFAVEDLAPNTATLRCKPSNDTDTYFFNFAKVAGFGSLTDAEVVASIIADGITAEDLAKGAVYYSKEAIAAQAPLTPGTDYYVYAFGYNVGSSSASTIMFKQKFTTPGAGQPTTVEVKNLSNGKLIYWGQPFGAEAESKDYSDWEIHLADPSFDLATGKGTGEFLFIELIAAKSATSDITPGTYTVCNGLTLQNLVAFNCMPGIVSDGYMVSTWYSNLVTATTGQQWPISGGTVKVSKSDSNYTIVLDLKSSSKNGVVTGTYTGPLTFQDKPKAPASAPWAGATNASHKLTGARANVRVAADVRVAANVQMQVAALEVSGAPNLSSILEAKFQQAEFIPVATGSESKTVMSSYEAVRMQ